MLKSEERNQLVSALKAWAESVPDEPSVGFLGGDKLFTPLQLLQEVQAETPDGQAIIDILEHGVRREGLSQVLARLSGEKRLAVAY